MDTSKIKAVAIALMLPLSFVWMRAAAPAPSRGASQGVKWDEGKGVTGLRLSRSQTAFVESYGQFIKGNLRSSSEAASAWTAGARAAALRHFDRLSISGSVDLAQTWGQGMAGSMMARPGAYMIDFYEFTPDFKLRRQADLSAGLCHDLSEAWRWGFRGEGHFARNQKPETLQHSASYLAGSIQPGVQYHRDRFAISLNYLYAYNADRILVGQTRDGTAEPPLVFYDRGLFYGTETPWYLSDVAADSGLLLTECFHGLSLQLSEGAFYADVAVRLRDARARTEVEFADRFNGWDLDADADWRRGAHHFHASVDYLAQQQVVETVPYSTRRNLKGSLLYGYSGRGWSLSATASLLDREGSTQVSSSYEVSQRVLIPAVDLLGNLSLGRASLRLAAGWTCGTLTESVLPPGLHPLRLDRYFVKYREHMTSQKIVLSPGVRYRFGGGLYADASLWWNHGFRLEYLGSDRIRAAIRLGYEF